MEAEEHSFPTSGIDETRLRFIADGVATEHSRSLWDRMVKHIQDAMEARLPVETRRYRDPREHDPDYNRRLRELEGDISQEVRMRDYHERGGKNSWKDWILVIVGLVIVAWLERLDSKLDEMADLKAQETILEERQNQINKHLESTDGRLDRIETKVYRGSP